MAYTAPAPAAPAASHANVLPATVVASPKPPLRSSDGRRVATQALVIGAALVILIASFAIGALVNGFTSSRNDKAKKAHGFVDEEVPAAVATTSSPTSTIGDLNLVPATSTETVGSTTLPPLVDPDHQYQQGYQGGDATAMSEQQYVRMTQAPMVTTTTPAASVNPLSVPATPAVPATPPPAPRPRPAPPREVDVPQRHVEHTDAVPLSQPLPNIDTSRLKHDANLRFNLTIGPDGRVKEVEIVKGAEGITAKMISKIQSWRFKPATADGRPVESHFPVDISFNAP